MEDSSTSHITETTSSVGLTVFVPRKSRLGTYKKKKNSTIAELADEHNGGTVPSKKGVLQPLPKQNIFFETSKPAARENCAIVSGKRYEIKCLISSGGSSRVYEVIDPSGKVYAMKEVLLTGVDRTIANCFLKEVKILEGLQKCRFVIKMIASELIQNDNLTLYVIMEKGEMDLATLMKDSSKSRDIYAILFFWVQMVQAVREIHTAKIIHSDLKPANFMLVRGTLKLIDFGISSPIPADMTSVYNDVALGTPSYMSPEAIQGQECCGMNNSNEERFRISPKSDIWSLGCILYRWIYGKTPFGHISNRQMQTRAITNPSDNINFPAPSIYVPEVLMGTLKSCLQKNPISRPTAQELLTSQYAWKIVPGENKS